MGQFKNYCVKGWRSVVGGMPQELENQPTVKASLCSSIYSAVSHLILTDPPTILPTGKAERYLDPAPKADEGGSVTTSACL